FHALYSNALFRVIGDFEFKTIVTLSTSRTEKIIVDIGDDGFLNISEDETKVSTIFRIFTFTLILLTGKQIIYPSLVSSVFKVFISLALLRNTSNAESEVIDNWYNNHSTRVKVSIWRDNPTMNKVEIIQEEELNQYSEDQESNFEILLESSSKGKGKHPNLNSEDRRRYADALGSTSNDHSENQKMYNIPLNSEDRRRYADTLGSTSNDFSEDQRRYADALGSTSNDHSEDQKIYDIPLNSKDISEEELNIDKPVDVNWMNRLSSYYNEHFKPLNGSTFVDPFEE
ncbi:2209_t:CDS:2, partial [Racocetra persica]